MLWMKRYPQKGGKSRRGERREGGRVGEREEVQAGLYGKGEEMAKKEGRGGEGGTTKENIGYRLYIGIKKHGYIYVNIYHIRE